MARDTSSSNIAEEIPEHLFRVICDSFPHKVSGDALVASVYGEWGCGKTWCLKQLEQRFDDYGKEPRRLTADSSSEQANGDRYALYVPVFFSPWRYEQEAHLVIPLIKTVERSISAYQKSNFDPVNTQQPKRARLTTWFKKITGQTEQSDQTEGTPFSAKEAADFLTKSAKTIGSLATSIAAGMKFSFGLPMAKIDIDGKKMLDEARAQDAANKQQSPNDFAESLESLYYDCFSSLEQMTQSDSHSRFQLRLVVLIDDLDRCLPEKAVQMLESIKLFLNMPNFAFVLAVDDEVIERGINHRYRDYYLKQEKDQEQNGIQPPITGSEYLEKIVHLPVHLPRWSKNQVEGFILSHFPDLYYMPANTAETTAAKSRDASSEDVQANGSDENAEQQGQEAAQQVRRHLLALFTDPRVVPPIPRKLIRLAEAIRFRLVHLQQLGASDFILQHDSEYTHMARLLLLQQIYPDIFRMLRSSSAIYDWLFDSRFVSDEQSPGKLMVNKETVPKAASSAGVLWQRFCQQLLATQHNRYGLNVFAAFSGEGQKPPAGVHRERFNQYYIYAEAASASPSTAPASSAAGEQQQLPVAQLSVSAEEATEALLSQDIAYRQAFINDNHLTNRQLPSAVFTLLNEKLDQQLDAQPSYQGLLTDLRWLTDMAEVTSPEQLKQLYLTHRILEKIQANQGRAHEQ